MKSKTCSLFILVLFTTLPLMAGETQTGKATFYADKFHGRTTASGEKYDKRALTAAHRTLPFGTRLRVTCLDTDRSVEVLVNDRGPNKKKKERILDLSRAAAEELQIVRLGVAQVRIEVLKMGDGRRKKK